MTEHAVPLAEPCAGMVVWMRYRRHGWPSTMEMVGAMFAPVALLAPFTLAGAVSGHALMMVRPTPGSDGHQLTAEGRLIEAAR